MRVATGEQTKKGGLKGRNLKVNELRGGSQEGGGGRSGGAGRRRRGESEFWSRGAYQGAVPREKNCYHYCERRWGRELKPKLREENWRQLTLLSWIGFKGSLGMKEIVGKKTKEERNSVKMEPKVESLPVLLSSSDEEHFSVLQG